MPNFASDILVNVIRTKIPLNSISFSSLVSILVLVLVSLTIIQNVFVIFVVIDEKTGWKLSGQLQECRAGSREFQVLGDVTEKL